MPPPGPHSARYEANLRRLSRELHGYADALGISHTTPSTALASRISAGIFLSHSTPSESFSNICRSRQLLSPVALAASRATSLRADCAEAKLGTADSVFLYAAPFRYPATACGFLFDPAIEGDNSLAGVAAPFDSGALMGKVRRLDQAEPAMNFLERHELPIPAHREYLALQMEALFDSPLDYLGVAEPRRPGPIGLSGGDCRRWTHEVRLPGQVALAGRRLQAVFASRALVETDPDVRRFIESCRRSGVDWVSFGAARAGDFEGLRRACVSYIRRKLHLSESHE
jgi:hypothetical protein